MFFPHQTRRRPLLAAGCRHLFTAHRMFPDSIFVSLVVKMIFAGPNSRLMAVYSLFIPLPPYLTRSSPDTYYYYIIVYPYHNNITCMFEREIDCRFIHEFIILPVLADGKNNIKPTTHVAVIRKPIHYHYL